MPTPEGLNTTILHGKYVEPNATGTPLQGTLTFTPNPSIILFPDENVIVAGTETATLDANGEFTIELVSTDQSGENPTNWVYTVVEKLIGQRQRSYNIALPYTSGVTVELPDITPTDVAPNYLPVVGPQGPPGVVTEVNGKSAAIITLTAADVDAIPTTDKGAASGVASLTAAGKHTASEYDGATVVLTSTMGAANGVATLDSGSKVPVAQIPDLSSTYILSSRINANNGVAGLGSTGLVGSAQLDLATAAPPSVGTAAVGTSTKLARQDHTHAGVDLTTNQTVGGVKSFSSNVQINAGARIIQFAGDAVSLVGSIFVNGESNDRWQIKSAGDMYWGPGNAVQDVNLKRTAAGELTASGQLALGSTAPTAAGHATRKDYVDNNFVNLTGSQTISGQKTFTGAPIMQQSAASTLAFHAKVSGDAASRLTIAADGTHNWGDGTGGADVNLYRAGVNVLASDDIIRANRTNGTDTAFATKRAAETSHRWVVTADGAISWGTGAGAFDTNLYRSAADTLKTDDSLDVAGVIIPLRSTFVDTGTNSTTTSTTYAAASAALSTTIVVPPSGKVMVTLFIRCDNSGGSNTLSDVQVTGSSSGSLYVPQDNNAIQWANASSAGPFVKQTLITGTPGETLTISAQHRVVANTGNFRYRAISAVAMGN